MTPKFPRTDVPPKRGAGAGVGNGMLRGGGIPLKENQKGLLVSWFAGFNLFSFVFA